MPRDGHRTLYSEVQPSAPRLWRSIGVFCGHSAARHRLFTAGCLRLARVMSCSAADGPMQDRIFTVRFLRASVLALILFGAAACSTSSKVDVMLFADPGKYEYHTCDQILAAGHATAAREVKLRQLIERAEQGAAGGLVSTVAYRGEYRTVVEELGVIDTVSRQKKCLTPASWRSSTAIQ